MQSTDEIQYDKFYVIDFHNILFEKDKIIKKKKKKIASADEIQYDKFYVIDFNNIKIDKDKIIKDKEKK